MDRIANATIKLNEHEEIEVTPEMMRAGIEEYALFSFEDRGEWVVSAIYRAMERAKADLGAQSH
jgi:hypothetical protein